MSSPNHEGGSHTPDFKGDQNESDMVEIKKDEDSTESPRATPKAASNARDPSRPRRKKARRACMACQRAHLTCGKWSGLRFLSYLTL